MSNDYYKGYAAGHLAAQPEWISVKDRLPERSGNYFTIKEAVRGAPGIPIGTITLDLSEQWHHHLWRRHYYHYHQCKRRRHGQFIRKAAGCEEHH